MSGFQSKSVVFVLLGCILFILFVVWAQINKMVSCYSFNMMDPVPEQQTQTKMNTNDIESIKSEYLRNNSDKILARIGDIDARDCIINDNKAAMKEFQRTGILHGYTEWHQYPIVCDNLDELGYPQKCSWKNCSKCVPPTHSEWGWMNDLTQKVLDKEKETRDKRYKILMDLLKDMDKDKPIILLLFNHGFSLFYLNWLCSLKYHNIDKEILSNTLVLTTDIESELLVKTVSPNVKIDNFNWLGNDFLNRIDKKAPKVFGSGAFNWLVSLQIVGVNDLINLGYHVLLCDMDNIFIGNPIPYLINKINNENIDIMMQYDGQFSASGPGNSGFMLIKNSCYTRILCNIMVYKLIGIPLRHGKDQQLWNYVLQEKIFRQINFKLMDVHLFKPGSHVTWDVNTLHDIHKNTTYIFHASWTTDNFEKIIKFNKVGHYYFTKNKCNNIFEYFKSNKALEYAKNNLNDITNNFTMFKYDIFIDTQIPDWQHRYEHDRISKKGLIQEKYLKKSYLIRDTNDTQYMIEFNKIYQ